MVGGDGGQSTLALAGGNLTAFAPQAIILPTQERNNYHMGILRFLGKLIAFLLVLLVIVLLPSTLWLYHLQRIALDATTYTRLLSNRALYTEVIPGMLMGTVQTVQDDPNASAEERAMAGYLAYLRSDDWKDILEALAPASWLQSEFEQNIQAVFDWLEGSALIPDVRFDITPFKDRLAGPEGEQTIRTIMASWPECSAEEAAVTLAILDGEAEGDDAVVLPCRLEGPDNVRLTQDVNEVVVAAAAALPDSIPGRIQASALTPRQEADLMNLKLFIGIIRRVAYLIFLIPLILLVLIEVVTVRSIKSLFSWYGWPLVLGGLLSFLPLLVLPFVWLTTFAGERFGDFRFFVTLMSLFTDSFGRPVLIQGGAITLAGFALLIFASLIPSPEEQAAV